MDYEKLHKYTITKLQQMVNSGKITVETARGICADFVPESDDERIRKAIIEFFELQDDNTTYSLIPKKDILAWLEKQGEKGIVLRDTFGYEEGRQKGQEEGIMLVLDNPQKYGLEKQGEQSKTLQTDDVPNESSTAAPLRTGAIGFDGEPMESKPCEQKPAWSEEDQETIDYLIDYLEDKLDCSYTDLDKETFTKEITLLKSLKERVQPQPALNKEKSNQKQDVSIQINPSEYINDMGGNGCYLKNTTQTSAWTEEDIKIIDMIEKSLHGEHYAYYTKPIKEMSSWLKSLKERYTWKPSDEQMKALDIAIKAGIQLGTWEEKALRELKEQLKKL